MTRLNGRNTVDNANSYQSFIYVCTCTRLYIKHARTFAKIIDISSYTF